MKFWDSSAIVPLLVEQPLSGCARASWKKPQSEAVVWWGTVIECTAALCRLAREGALDERELAGAENALKRLSRVWHEIQPSALLRAKAQRLLRVHSLRAQDSQQLAAAMIASEDLSAPIPFVCFDDRLGEAARREGLEVLGAGEP